ncbi:MAG: CHAT domain-containing protein, partial [Bacteroidota bacterium]
NVEIRDELVIIPYGRLSLISFEMLDANEKGREVSYVLEKHPVRYELSASLMFNEYHKKRNPDLKRFGGFASSNFNLSLPDTSGDTMRTSLIGTENEFLFGTSEEVKSINNIMNGDVYLNTKPFAFLNNAGNYKVLHIATHAFSDQGPFHECKFLFETDSAGKNTVNDIEIASMKLNARMTVLSACNTGLGQLHSSEGMISLGRSFFIAGCPSVVMSLWTVNDASTSKIMTAFYSHLKKGETKSEALRNAKLDYLKNETNPAKKHPYYWAGFIVVGNNSPLPSPDFLRLHWAAIMSSIAVVFIVLLYFRMRSNKTAA